MEIKCNSKLCKLQTSCWTHMRPDNIIPEQKYENYYLPNRICIEFQKIVPGPRYSKD